METQERINDFIRVSSKNIECDKKEHQGYYLTGIIYENDKLKALCSKCYSGNYQDKLIPQDKFYKNILQQQQHYLTPLLEQLGIQISELQNLKEKIEKKIKIDMKTYENQTIPKIIESTTSKELNTLLEKVSIDLINQRLTLEESLNISPKQILNQTYLEINKLLKNINNNSILTNYLYNCQKLNREFDNNLMHQSLYLQNGTTKVYKNSNNSQYNAVLLKESISKDCTQYQAFKIDKLNYYQFLGVCKKEEFESSNRQDVQKKEKSVSCFYNGDIYYKNGYQISTNLQYSQGDIVVIKVDLKKNTVGFKNINRDIQYIYESEESLITAEEDLFFFVELFYNQDSVSLIPMQPEYIF